MPGYREIPDASARTRVGGWLMTGDAGRVDGRLAYAD
jgi:long-subunit acyl-CoA synthetase (AMP-forming)